MSGKRLFSPPFPLPLCGVNAVYYKTNRTGLLCLIIIKFSRFLFVKNWNLFFNSSFLWQMKWFMYSVKRVNTCALCRSFVSSSIVSGGIIVVLCFILYDVTGDRFTLNMSR